LQILSFDKSFVSKINLGSCFGQIEILGNGEVAKIMVFGKKIARSINKGMISRAQRSCWFTIVFNKQLNQTSLS
jgi:hypothetical protein